jgi:hypothetical protein
VPNSRKGYKLTLVVSAISEAGLADAHGMLQLDGADPVPFCRLKNVQNPLARALQEAFLAVERVRAKPPKMVTPTVITAPAPVGTARPAPHPRPTPRSTIAWSACRPSDEAGCSSRTTQTTRAGRSADAVLTRRPLMPELDPTRDADQDDEEYLADAYAALDDDQRQKATESAADTIDVDTSTATHADAEGQPVQPTTATTTAPSEPGTPATDSTAEPSVGPLGVCFSSTIRNVRHVSSKPRSATIG